MPASVSLSTYRTIYLYLYVPRYGFVLDRYLACSILVVYISPFARPQPGIEIQSFFPPSLHSRVCRLSSQALRPLRTRSRAVGATRAQHGLHRYVLSRIPSRIHTHTHTHTHSLSLSLSLSLSPSQRQQGYQPAHTAPRSALRAFSFRGRRSVILLHSFPNSRADSHSAIQCHHCRPLKGFN
jgi:hypothetical protein